MKVEAIFSGGITELLDGAAIGDEFTVVAHARIVAAEETLIEVTRMGESDPSYVQGELNVKLFLSHPEKQ